MLFANIPAGNEPPHDINVVIEIPALSEPIKYEIDKESGAIWVDRFMGTSMHYPCNYGYIPQTLGDDGDPVDVLVVTPIPLAPSCVIRCRPVGVLDMIDESGRDEKLIAVPMGKLTSIYDHVKEATDLPQILLDQIKHFFEHYKDLEPGKWVKVESWHDAAKARDVIRKGIDTYNKG